MRSQLLIPKNVTYSKKDIFEISLNQTKSKELGSNVIIPHVCNNVNAFGAGFARDISHHYPIVKDNYHLLGKKQKLGHVQYITVYKDNYYDHELIIANMIGQNGLKSPKNKRPLNYYALAYCMSNVSSFIKNSMVNDTTAKYEIHCPKFGSGLAGGNWNFILNLIEDIWTNYPVVVYEQQRTARKN